MNQKNIIMMENLFFFPLTFILENAKCLKFISNVAEDRQYLANIWCIYINECFARQLGARHPNRQPLNIKNIWIYFIKKNSKIFNIRTFVLYQVIL